MTTSSVPPRVSVVDLTEYYGQTLVLDEVFLDVAEHEVVCLIGASGSGKSTLLRCVNALVPFDHGRILLDGVPIDDPSLAKGGLRKRTGIVFQAFKLFPHLTVLDNITLSPRKVHGIGKREALKDDGMTMMIVTHEMGFARDVADRVCFLDGGRIVEEGPPSRLLADPTEPQTRRLLQRIIDAGRL